MTGGVIATQLAVGFPDRLRAIHLNQASVSLPSPLPAELQTWKAGFDKYLRRESAYRAIQDTKPDSLTVALDDSPAGLAAWIIEKFREWGDTHGDIESAFSKDDLITNLMFYWLPGSAGSAARIYREFRSDPAARALEPVRVPTAFAAFPAEPFAFPRQLVERRYRDLRRWTDLPRLGHFGAMEQPELLARDIRKFFAAL